MQGYINIHRKILNWYGFTSPTRLKIWLTLMLLANHQDRRITFNGEPTTIKRGQFVTSRSRLAKLLNMSGSWVEKVLNEFEKDGQIRQDAKHTSRLISIVNYDNHQNYRQAKHISQCQVKTDTNPLDATVTEDDVSNGVSCEDSFEDSFEDTNNNDKNDNNKYTIYSPPVNDSNKDKKEEKNQQQQKPKEEKNRHMEFVLLTTREYDKLVVKLGRDNTDLYIQKLNYYIGSRGKQYKSHYFTILNWWSKETKKPSFTGNYREL